MEGERMSITFISAGAGSGKTHTLNKKIREAIEHDIPPEKIVATTFTVKAAAEIRERVHSEFLAEKNIANANKSNSVMIGTINSVCGTLLSRYALQAGLSPILTVLDAPQAAAILREVVMSTVSEENKLTLDDIEKRFDHQWKDNMTWNAAIAGIVDKMRSYQIDPSRLEKIGDENASAMCAVLGCPLGNNDSSLVSVLEEALKELDAIPAANKQTDVFKDYYELCLDASRDINTFRDKWNYRVDLAGKTCPTGCKVPWNRVHDAAGSWRTNDKFHQDIHTYIRLVFSSAAEVCGQYQNYKKRNGWIDFTDQEVILYRLLDREDVVSHLKESLSLLLVDEFQDISPIQLALFFKLSLYAENTYWIGDIKQAIYGFRGSDSSLVEAVIDNLEKSGNKIETLPDSYRSVPALVELCNEAFTAIFDGVILKNRVVLNPTRKATGSTAFMHWELSGPKKTQWDQIAAGFKTLVAQGYKVSEKKTNKDAVDIVRPVGWNDIAVLVRLNTDVEELCTAFRNAGIPLKISGKGLFTTPEAVLLTACLKRLSDIHDTLASTEILSLTQGLSPQDWLVERLEWLKDNDEFDGKVWRADGDNRNELLAILESIRPRVDYLGITALLDMVIMRGEIEKICIGWTSSADTARERLVNIQAFREAVSKYERSNTVRAGLGNLVLWIQEQTEGADSRPPSPVPGVWISTWHGAKGLEWPVCLCYMSQGEKEYSVCNTVRGISAEPVNIDNLLEGASLHFWPWPFGAKHEIKELSFSSGKGMAPIINRKKMEENRLFYVGLTRARDLLILPLFLQKDLVKVKPPSVEFAESASNLLFTPHPGINAITLANGTSVPYEYWRLAPSVATGVLKDDDTQKGKSLHWFKKGERKDFLPAILTPSAHESSAKGSTAKPCLGNSMSYGPALERVSKIPIDLMGTAYHDSFAFLIMNADHAASMSSLAGRFGDPAIAANVHSSIKGCLALLRSIWPDCLFHTELSVSVPVQDGSGQIIVARLDLLVETDAGFYIVDHKLTADSIIDMNEFAGKYQNQLSLYRQAIDAFGGKKVFGAFLNLPQEGRVVEVGLIE